MQLTQRFALAKFRCGVAPFRKETGRYKRFCQLRPDTIKQRNMYCWECPVYYMPRQQLLVKFNEVYNRNFDYFCDNGVNESLWNCQHPENWSTSAVQEWITFTSSKYNFKEHIRARIVGSLHGYTGKRLLAMLLPDFRIQFGDVGELIFTAFQQILDVAPRFEERASVYASKINRLLDDLAGASTSDSQSSLWKALQLEHWSSIEVHDWIKSAAVEYNIESRDRKLLLDRFSRHAGVDLISMTLEDFKTISVVYGETLFMTIHSHKQEENAGRKRHRSSSELQSIPENKECP